MLAESRNAVSSSAQMIAERIVKSTASLCFCALLLAGAVHASAADYVWRSVKVGGGGYSPDIVFSKAERGLVYLRTDIGGVYRWDAKAGAWIALQDKMGTGTYYGIESVAPDPVDPNTVYVAAGMYRADQAALLRSRNRGDSWTVIQVPFHMGGNEIGRAAGERLAVDPNDTSILYFGSRWDGLQKSTDSGDSWSAVASFPLAGHGGAADYSKPVSFGISFVIFDPASGKKGSPTRTLFAGDADPGAHHLFRSDDAGQSWSTVAGEPRADLVPVKAEMDADGILYITYGNVPGPFDITDGAVFKLDTHSGKWTDIMPDKSAKRPPGGYMGLALDRQHPGTLLAATGDRWLPVDTIWRTTDGGAHWQDIGSLSKSDVSETPYLLWGGKEAKFGWMISGLAIDPLDSTHVAFTTGATVYASNDLGKPAMLWKPWINGVEETAILTLASPPAGPPLLSGFGDIGGFAHDKLDVSPSSMFTNPVFGNTNTIDFAGMAPNIVVRSGTSQTKDGPTLAYSTDYGHSWAPIIVPPLRGKNAQGAVELKRYDLDGDINIVTSADGKTFIVMTPIPLLTHDHGLTWAAAKGLPLWSRVVADRVDPQRFYAFDLVNLVVLASNDGGASFLPLATTGLPGAVVYKWPTNPDAAWPLMATPGIEGDLWIKSGDGQKLFHSSDGGQSFKEVITNMSIDALAFGKAAPGKDYPTLFAFGWNSPVRMIFRSTDMGKTWKRINDDDHQYGWRFRCIAGDPRVFGRVYVGTDGRGIVYGEPEE
ncbi:MAG: xyloglucanase [Rhizomicrobium sp.]